jgi:hypothetical protein
VGALGARLAKGEERIESLEAAFVSTEGLLGSAGGAVGAEGAADAAALRVAALRVAALGEAVERLSGNLDAARAKDVAALAEDRTAATVRKVQHQVEAALGAQGELRQRLSTLEATVVQEQRASLSALEAMIKSPTITRVRKESPTATPQP